MLVVAGAVVNLRFVDWIWHVRGSLSLAPGQSNDDVFTRLDPLFAQRGTSTERDGDTLVFRKKDQAAQDKMSVFDGGVVTIEPGAAGSVLRYRLTSRALLACFLAPLLFVGLAQLTINFGKAPKPPEAESAAAKDKKKTAEKDVPKLHPIDVALGAPAPEKAKQDKEDKKPSGTPGYVLAAMFAALYVVGRILEDRLVKALFRRQLLGA